MTYSFSYLEPVCCSMSSSNCCFLTCIQVSQEAGQVVWYSHLLQNFPVYCDPHSQRLWLSQKSRNRFFLELSWFFDDLADVGNLMSGSSAFSRTSLSIWKFTVHVLLKPGLENFEHYMKPIRLINFVLSSVAQSCPTLCNPMNRSTPGLPVHHQLPEFTQTHVHRVIDAIQPSHPLLSPSPPAPNPSQHQSLFQ